MIFIFNGLGVGFALLGLAAGYVLYTLVPSLRLLNDPLRTDLGLVVIGLSMAIADLIFRWNAHRRVWYRRAWLIHPQMGGQIFFIPSWIIGIAVCFGRQIGEIIG